jgi:hypothetical protein
MVFHFPEGVEQICAYLQEEILKFMAWITKISYSGVLLSMLSMLKKKKSKKCNAALQREASKQGDVIPDTQPVILVPDILCDLTYDPLGSKLDLGVEIPTVQSQSNNNVAKKEELVFPCFHIGIRIDITGFQIKKHKERHENADILPERPTKASRTTDW